MVNLLYQSVIVFGNYQQFKRKKKANKLLLSVFENFLRYMKRIDDLFIIEL
jgi:hypothetical protein